MGFAVCEAFKTGMRFVWSKRQARFARCGRVRNEREGLSSCSYSSLGIKNRSKFKGVKLILAHIAPGHRAMNKEARSAASPLAQV